MHMLLAGRRRIAAIRACRPSAMFVVMPGSVPASLRRQLQGRAGSRYLPQILDRSTRLTFGTSKIACLERSIGKSCLTNLSCKIAAASWR